MLNDIPDGVENRVGYILHAALGWTFSHNGAVDNERAAHEVYRRLCDGHDCEVYESIRPEHRVHFILCAALMWTFSGTRAEQPVESAAHAAYRALQKK